MWDGFDNTADALEDWHYSRVEADMEMAEMIQQANTVRQMVREGNCPHMGAAVLFRPVAFYPEQVGLTQGQAYCYECESAYADPNGPDCMVCDLDKHNCMAERGFTDNGKYSHDHYVLPPMILVSVAPEGGFGE